MIRLVTINCPTRKGLSSYHFVCTFNGSDFRPRSGAEKDRNDAKFVTLSRYGNAELTITFAPDRTSSTALLMLGTGHVCDHRVTPWHCYTEAPRPVKLTSAPL